MARLNRIPPFTGTKDGICIYFMRGEFFVRTASSLTAGRVKTDPAFAETRRYSDILAKASKISSVVYRRLSGKHKNHDLYNKMTGQAIRMLRDNRKEYEIIDLLSEWYE